MIYERFKNELSALSSAQLKDVRKALDEAEDARKKYETQALRDEFASKASELGIDLRDLLGSGFGKGASSRKGKKVDPKYRIVAPDGTIHEWSGRGIKPKAFSAYSKEELEARFKI